MAIYDKEGRLITGDMQDHLAQIQRQPRGRAVLSPIAPVLDALPKTIDQRIAEAVAAEREACAQIAENAIDQADDPYCCKPLARSIAKEIRAREK